jgi:hypothetical protein
MAFVKSAAFQFQQLRIKKMKEEQEAEQVLLGILPFSALFLLSGNVFCYCFLISVSEASVS